MPFQSTVTFNQAFGVPGQLFDTGPKKVEPFILNSASAAYNVFGSAFTVVSEGIAQAGNPSASVNTVFAGILVNPKTHASLGTSNSTLAPTLTLPNNEVAELITIGSVIVTLPAAAAIGDLVIFDNVTGALSTITPATALPAGKTSAHAVVDRFTVAGAGLAVITLLNAPKIPA